MREKREIERSMQEYEARRSHAHGKSAKNARLILDALAVPTRRRMLMRLHEGGAMSLSKLAEPFRIALPSALEHVQVLERANLITTHKQGRVRMCVYNPTAFRELCTFLASPKWRFEES